MGRKLARAAFLFSVVVALASPAHAGTAKATLKDASGKAVGTATLADTPSGLLIRLNLAGVPAGEHAFHIHAVGKCEAPDFKSAGPHFNPDKTKHGLMNAEGPHAGDMPNLYVPADGKLEIEVLNPKATLTALLDADGSALVIHAGADDYKTDPAGNAGDRIACGVITP
jgi:Cu-Zn family superoxide dismutase